MQATLATGKAASTCFVGGKAIGLVAAGMLTVLFAMAALLAALAPVLSSTPSATGGAGATAVVQAALALQQRISGQRSNLYNPANPLMQKVAGYWRTYCSDGHDGLCALATPGGLQCVQFVSAAYWLAGDPLPSLPNGQDFWEAYAKRAGWQRIASPSSFSVAFVPPSPGDIMVWKGGGHVEHGVWREYGHVAIVISYQPPRAGQNGMIEVGQANAPGCF